MFESSPRRLAASVAKRKFHSANTITGRPLPSRTNGQTLASRLIPKAVKTSLLVDQLGISLALPIPVPLGGLSDFAILSLSAALRFRTDLTPLGFGLDTSRSKARMLVEEKTTTKSQFPEGDNFPADGIAGPPPAYSQSVSTPKVQEKPGATGLDGSVENPAAEGLPLPSNLVHIYRLDGRINGRWNIDPTLEVPAAFLPPTEGDARTPRFQFSSGKKSEKAKDEVQAKEPTPNLKLHTRDGRIVADVSITGTPDGTTTTKPTLLDLYTRDGLIQLRLRSRGPSPVHMKLYTHDGSIRVFLPRSFTGILKHELRDGSLVVSPEMQKHGGVTTFTSIEGAAGRSFVGDLREFKKQANANANADDGGGSVNGPADTWTGDCCEVVSRDGCAYFYWEDEYDATMANLTAKGWIKSLFSR